MNAWAASPETRPTRVARDVYVLSGRNGEISAEAGGDIGNSGFIVGPRGVVVIDTGVSKRAGERLLAQIAATTRKPVRLAIVTHAIQEFLFGSTAFEARGIPLLAHRKSAELMRQRCNRCLKNLNTILGKDAMRGTRLVIPGRLVDGPMQLDSTGRELRLLHFGWAATPGDLAVFDPQSGVLFAGGLIDAERIPSLRDAYVQGWIAALEMLRGLPIRRIVPGHGPVGGKEEVDRMLDYLRQLDVEVRKRYDTGDGLLETVNTLHLPAFADWQGYATVHPQNVQYLYQALETAELTPAR